MYYKNWWNNNRWCWGFRFSHANVQYGSHYSETTGSLWFYSKDEAIDLYVDIANTNDFKSFKYNVKLSGKTEADNANGILKNTIIAAPLKYLSNFWRSLEETSNNCKIELKL